MFIVFFGSVILKDSPLNAVQMLWVNLIMDTLAALALATEPPDLTILERMPQPSSNAIVTDIMWRNVYGHAIYQMTVLIVILFVAQGTLVHTYERKCLGTTNADTNECNKGGLNPFYAGNHYFELDTKVYWTQTMKDKTNADEFDAESWW
jgi:magnesium-transporting ATPase (P-type)